MKTTATLLWILLLFCGAVQAQPLLSSTYSPNPLLSCDQMMVNVIGNIPCFNATLDSTGSAIVGNVIVVNVYVTQPIICAPAIQPYNVTEAVGMVPPGSYTLQTNYVENVNTIISTLTQSLTVGSCCTVNSSFTASETTICMGDSIILAAIDGSLNSYDWKLDGNSFSTAQNSSLSFGMAGSYVVTMVGADSSCTDSSSQTITVTTFPQVNVVNVMDESCPNDMDGSIDISISGGTSPYTTTWSTGALTEDISQLTGGVYTVTVSDQTGCTTLDSVEVLPGMPVTAAFSYGASNVICPGDSVPFNNASVGAGSYEWYANGSLFSQLENPSFGDTTGGYTIMMLASNATCTDTAFGSVTVTELPGIMGNEMDESCTNAQNGSIDVSVMGGSGSYTYSWSNGAMTEDIAQLSMGSYTLWVTDSLGCTSNASFSIGTTQTIMADYTSSAGPTICLNDELTFTNTSAGASAYEWFAGGLMFANSTDANYTFVDTGNVEIQLVASDSVCSDTVSSAFYVTPPPVITAVITDNDCPENMTGAIDLSLSAGADPYTYSWSSGDNTEDIMNLSADSYIVWVTDENQCVYTDTFEIETLGGITATYSISANGYTIQFMDLSDSSAVSWGWDFGDGSPISTLQHPQHTYAFDGTYLACLTVTDSFGCMDSICMEVTVPNTDGVDDLISVFIAAYPNPTNGQLWLETPDLVGRDATIQILDMLGREIGSADQRLTTKTALDLSKYSAGTYLIRIKTEDRQYWAKVRKNSN